MIVTGSGRDHTLGKTPQTFHCPTCNATRTAAPVLLYEWKHVWGFGQVTKRSYHVACLECEGVAPLAPAKVDELKSEFRIPFLREWGFFVFLGLIMVPFIYAALRSHLGA